MPVSLTALPEVSFTRNRKHDHHHPGKLVETFDSKELRGVSICFINMPLRESAKPNTAPQGPGLMAARLREFGAGVSLIDLNAYRIDTNGILFDGKVLTAPVSAERPNGRHLSEAEAETLIEKYFTLLGAPDIIGLSGMITTLRWQQIVARICKKLSPQSFLVSGGGLATEVKAGLFQEGWVPELDAISHSEGDDVVLIMARDIKRTKEYGGKLFPSPDHEHCHLVDVAGRSRYVYHGNRPINLDSLPLEAWDLMHRDAFDNPIFDWYLKTPVWGRAANNSSATSFGMNSSSTSVSSRGCPFKCKFCFRGSTGETDWTVRSAAHLRKELKYNIENYGIDFHGFNDDNFAVNEKRMFELPTFIGDLDIRWGTHTRMDEADGRLEPMAKSGCIYIGFGAESASPKVLESMGKGGQILQKGLTEIDGFKVPTSMINAVHNCKHHGVHANCTWIMGYPDEELYDLQTSVRFMMWQIETLTRGLTPDSPEYEIAKQSVNTKMFVATAYLGTEMFRNERVRLLLNQHFGIKFNLDGTPVPDKALLNYVLELDDATKLLHGSDGAPINFGNIPEAQFIEARRLVDTNQTEKILDLK